MAEQRRRTERIPYPCDVECIGAGGETIVSSRLSDLSAEGAFVESVNELPLGTRLRLRFVVGSRMIEAGAEIVHSMPQFGFGVRFTDLRPEDRDAIAERVAAGG